ncbi:MAG: hypothetical protein E6J77_18470 [Deltaproteobacteria bacterium]|nr:MAG: hypothetical protein E6J77_18470 [Deltaproteobacteria bacterium]
MATKPDALGGPASEMSSVYAEGLLAGLGGATTIALWFLILDAFNGRPFYTPTVLGTALFHAGSGLETPETLPTSFETVVSFTWVHVLVFLAIGVAASRLIALAEQNPSFGFGIVLFFVFFQCAFFLTTADRQPPRRRDDDGDVLAPPPPPGDKPVDLQQCRARLGRARHTPSAPAAREQ